ncbi:hypothetical protein BABINDRAFT_108908 [Babjeviella inositovora NRRL Y-12698]|uniref:non-specific serine/threonine protein kinase n=1 Tax=Babjeviella inositovora NRRL Y-12698 TaxID=984486 RepID=A0A1E3QV86_9ASCO|nr:uncharacterized protein BABINDRAFT_108908 [Babjeviella inositovora NRRL Y-12698]ODQ81571.1 hypothetical protein BABINDRAFT_108908 [Babjeviella inositovora NRRL Y-12698]
MSRKRAVKDYQFGNCIGEGSYSKVYSAVDLHNRKTYAVKVLSKKHIVKEKKIKYVNIEKHTLNRLGNHPGIVQLYYTFQDDASLYFVIDFAEYGELLTIIRKYGSLNEHITRFYMAQILDAVEFMHSKGVIHRDLKPENILVNHHLRLMITDFGAAKLVGADTDADVIAPDTTIPGDESPRASSFVGTAEYVSPELLRHNQAGFECDIWALGCILYQFILGVPPFKGKTEYLTFEKIILLDYAFPPALYVPLRIKSLVGGLLRLDPLARLTIPEIKQHEFFRGADWADKKTIWGTKVPKFEPYNPRVYQREEPSPKKPFPIKPPPGAAKATNNKLHAAMMGLAITPPATAEGKLSQNGTQSGQNGAKSGQNGIQGGQNGHQNGQNGSAINQNLNFSPQSLPPTPKLTPDFPRKPLLTQQQSDQQMINKILQEKMVIKKTELQMRQNVAPAIAPILLYLNGSGIPSVGMVTSKSSLNLQAKLPPYPGSIHGVRLVSQMMAKPTVKAKPQLVPSSPQPPTQPPPQPKIPYPPKIPSQLPVLPRQLSQGQSQPRQSENLIPGEIARNLLPDEAILKLDLIKTSELPYSYQTDGGPATPVTLDSSLDDTVIQEIITKNRRRLDFVELTRILVITNQARLFLLYVEQNTIGNIQVINLTNKYYSMYDYEFNDDTCTGYLILELLRDRKLIFLKPYSLHTADREVLVPYRRGTSAGWVECLLQARELLTEEAKPPAKPRPTTPTTNAPLVNPPSTTKVMPRPSSKAPVKRVVSAPVKKAATKPAVSTKPAVAIKPVVAAKPVTAKPAITTKPTPKLAPKPAPNFAAAAAMSAARLSKAKTQK